jgi:hypothetical protein
MEYRWLSGDEILEWVNPVCKSRGWAELNVNDAQPTCRVLGAFGETLVGFAVLQLFPVLGPFFVEPSHRDGTISHELIKQMHEFVRESGVRGVLALCESPVAERLAERHGMTKIVEPVYMLVGGG